MPRIEANLGLQTFQTQVVFIHPAVPDQPAYTIDTSPSGPPRTPHPKPLQNSRSKHASARPSIRYPPNHPIPIPAKLHAQRPYPHQDPETTVLCKSNTEERESRKTGQQKKKGKRPAAAHLLRNSPRTPNSPHEPRCGAPPARSDGTNPPLFSFTNAGCGYQKMKERKKGKKKTAYVHLPVYFSQSYPAGQSGEAINRRSPGWENTTGTEKKEIRCGKKARR